MSFENWIYRKAEQNAHNEILAFLMVILGINLLIGGLLVTVISVGEPTLFPFLVQQPLSHSATLGLILTGAGFSLVSVGFVLVFHYDRERSWYMGELEKSSMHGKKRKTTLKTVDEILEEYIGKRKRS